MMKITAIHHVQLAIPKGGENVAREFYGGLLGLPEVRKPVPLAERGGVWFEEKALRVHLGVDAEFIPAKKAHPAFQVKDLLTLRAFLAENDVEVVGDDALSGFDRIYVNDPFGNRIELLEPRA